MAIGGGGLEFIKRRSLGVLFHCLAVDEAAYRIYKSVVVRYGSLCFYGLFCMVLHVHIFMHTMS